MAMRAYKQRIIPILLLLNSGSSRGCCWFMEPGFILVLQNLFIGHSTKISAFTLLSCGLQNQVTGLVKHYSRVTQSVSYTCLALRDVIRILIIFLKQLVLPDIFKSFIFKTI